MTLWWSQIESYQPIYLNCVFGPALPSLLFFSYYSIHLPRQNGHGHGAWDEGDTVVQCLEYDLIKKLLAIYFVQIYCCLLDPSLNILNSFRFSLWNTHCLKPKAWVKQWINCVLNLILNQCFMILLWSSGWDDSIWTALKWVWQMLFECLVLGGLVAHSYMDEHMCLETLLNMRIFFLIVLLFNFCCCFAFSMLGRDKKKSFYPHFVD